MKFILLLSLSVSFSARAATELKGTSHTGEPCSITVEQWDFLGEKGWETLRVTFRTSWLKAGNPSLVAKVAQTPFTMHAENTETRDQTALFFAQGEPELAGLRYFIFQSYDEERGAIQARCVLSR